MEAAVLVVQIEYRRQLVHSYGAVQLGQQWFSRRRVTRLVKDNIELQLMLGSQRGAPGF